MWSRSTFYPPRSLHSFDCYLCPCSLFFPLGSTLSALGYHQVSVILRNSSLIPHTATAQQSLFSSRAKVGGMKSTLEVLTPLQQTPICCSISLPIHSQTSPTLVSAALPSSQCTHSGLAEIWLPAPDGCSETASSVTSTLSLPDILLSISLSSSKLTLNVSLQPVTAPPLLSLLTLY